MSYFSYVGKLFSNVRGFYQEINAATLTGAIDTIIIEQEDGTYQSSPFHVRFGKLGVLRSKEKVVDIEINGEAVNIQMKLGDSGEAFFVEEYETESEEIPEYLTTSPLPQDLDLMEKGIQELQDIAAREEVEEKVSPEVQEEPDKVIMQAEATEESVPNLNLLESESKRQHLDSLRSESTVKSDNSRDADIEIKIDTVSSDNVKKRKKRRKRKNKVPKSDVQHNTTLLVEGDNIADDDIFEMEDISSDEELSRLTANMTNGAMSKSISLPVVEESSFDRTHEWASAHEGFSYLNNRPFSDTDLSPLASPVSSRPNTPKSDTEVERQKSIDKDNLLMQDDDDTLWEWGAMPRKSSTAAGSAQGSHAARTSQDDKVKSSGGLFQFMRKTKNVRHKPEAEGIYLDDLNLQDMDEETAKLYFPKRFSNSHFKSIDYKDEDVESGRGASLPQSPHSVEGAIGGPSSSSLLVSDVKHLGTYSLSLCGGLSEQEGVTLERFMSKIVTFDDLCEQPGMVNNPDLVVRIENNYYNWQTAAPIILAQIAFQKCLPDKTIQGLCSQFMPKKEQKKKAGYSWFSWRRGASDNTASPPSTTSIASTLASSDIEQGLIKSDAQIPSVVNTVETIPSSQASSTGSPRKEKPTDRLQVSATGDHSSSEGDTEGSDRGPDLKHKTKRTTRRHNYRKSLRLSSDQIRKLNLRAGQNEVIYSVTTQYQGTKRCHSHIYLWKYNDKIIVSDIDGTITKSDVLGQILPVMGRDWSQSGVAQLYSHISSNGYKFLYLSARAIGQSKLTKDLLQNIKQGGMTLPEGPLLLSPTSLISAFHREVIERKPEEFKISCLKDIGDLFPDNTQPFYAGFGNKVNDVYAYKAINIPIFRIFTINAYGELKHELSYTFQSSYTKLSDVADHFFPPLHKPYTRVSEFSQVQYWREPLPELSPIEIEEIKQSDPITVSTETKSS